MQNDKVALVEQSEDLFDRIPTMERTDILPDSIINAYRELSDEIRYYTEDEIRKHGKITIIDERLRCAFWHELQISIRLGKKLNLKRVYNGICTEQHFHRLIKDQLRFAWVTQPVIPYEHRTESLLTLAVGRYEEILNMNIMIKKKRTVGLDEDGEEIIKLVDEVDPSRARLLLDTIKTLEDRVKGVAVQRQSIMHENQQTNENNAVNMEEINSKLLLLEQQLGITNAVEVQSEDGELIAKIER